MVSLDQVLADWRRVEGAGRDRALSQFFVLELVFQASMVWRYIPKPRSWL